MNREPTIKQAFAIAVAILFFVLFLCGCTENNSSNDGNTDLSKFIGSWSGTMGTSMFGFRGNRTFGNITDDLENETRGNFSDFMINRTTSNITELEFTSDTLYMTLLTGNETQILPQTYTVEGDQLVVSMQFTGEPQDGEPPFGNESGRPPFDGQQPPSDGELPPFGGEFPQNGRRSFGTVSYTYRFNADCTILYLDGYKFIKYTS